MEKHGEQTYEMHGNLSTTLIVPQTALQACTRTHTWNIQDP